MAEKAKTPAPIDRPLSRAYLREFTGWSTAYPPGLSDPTSLRVMENLMVNRDGSLRIRPGLRLLSLDYIDEESGARFVAPEKLVGSHEVFFLEDGSKAYLFARRDADGFIEFKVLKLGSGTDPGTIINLADTGIGAHAGFDVPQGTDALRFSPETTYVKYLQIDNKIFALSNAGEAMRLFYVGSEKKAKRLDSITRPSWEVDDKLTVVHPRQAWLTSGAVTATRWNLIANPSFETNVSNWSFQAQARGTRSSAVGARNGAFAMRLESLPARTNLAASPLVVNGGTVDITNWYARTRVSGVYPSPFGLEAKVADGAHNTAVDCFAGGPKVPITAGQAYSVAFDFGYTIPGGGGATSGMGVRVIFYNASGTTVSTIDKRASDSAGRKTWNNIATAPSGATHMRIYPFVTMKANYGPGWVGGSVGDLRFTVRNVVICKNGESTSIFHGNSGTNYFWSGTAWRSASTYHPPVNSWFNAARATVVAGTAYTASAYIRAGGTARDLVISMHWYNSAGAVFSSTASAATPTVSGNWATRVSVTGTAPAGAVGCIVQVNVPGLPRNEFHYVDSVMLEAAGSAGTYFDGSTGNTTTLAYNWSGTAHGSSSRERTFSGAQTHPDPIPAKTANTLISSDATKNSYNFGFFYTFSNEVGESAASQTTVVRAQRGWAQWLWETMKSTSSEGEPSGSATADPNLSADQLVASMPQAVWDAAVAQGATRWNLYMFTWSNQDSVPVTAQLVGVKEIKDSSTYGADGWLRVTPQMNIAGDAQANIPSSNNRYNYSDPSKAGNGLVASDRMIMVYDPMAAAVVKWSSNQQGSYTDFSAALGGGYKTLTSGNLYVPAAVKLWQNPQSVDTLTVLCLGVDGYSTSYYMAPAQVTSQSESTAIMGFEETTATPGTTSPYGVEVLNNALYHPLDTELMKSTANNYNITHKSMTDQIRDMWAGLQSKVNIISSQHDNRIYYVVHNPLGEILEEGCHGNEIWVFDSAAEGGTWSRFLIQAHSLRKIAVGDKSVMSVIRPDGIFYLDETYDRDDYVQGLEVFERHIPWSMETNTQGANRAHDAWAHLKQAALTVGNYQGSMVWGIRGWDVNGKAIDESKVFRRLDFVDLEDRPPTDDLEDFLQISRGMKEWFLYAHSTVDDDGVTEYSFGQISLVQYRYAPISVNVGYEYGSVETFEYARARDNWVERTTDNGVPTPAIDTRRP